MVETHGRLFRNSTRAILISQMMLGFFAPVGARADDVAHYKDNVAVLEQVRSEFRGAGPVSLSVPRGNQLFWFEDVGSRSVLYRHEEKSAQTLKYSFDVGAGDWRNYRASPALIVVAAKVSEGISYTAWDANFAKGSKVGTLVLPAPEDGTKFFAYAVDGEKVYWVEPRKQDGDELSYRLKSWSPRLGADSVQEVLSFSEAGVGEMGEFMDFDVEGNILVFVESGRLWKIDLSLKKATPFKNKTEIKGTVDFSSDGVLFGDAKGVNFFSYADQSSRKLAEEIQKSPYRLNETYSSCHHFMQDQARWQDWFIYTGQCGIFGYHLKSKEVRPILLSPNEANLRVDYRYPVALEAGKLYVTGLTSASGSVGFEGPIYQVDLKTALGTVAAVAVPSPQPSPSVKVTPVKSPPVKSSEKKKKRGNK